MNRTKGGRISAAIRMAAWLAAGLAGLGGTGARAQTLNIYNATIPEGDTGTTSLQFQVTLTPAQVAPVTVVYTTTGGTATAGTDYVPASGTLTIPAGTTVVFLAVTVIGDTNREVSETINVALSNPSNAVLNYSNAQGTIQNDDAGVTIGDKTINEGGPGATNNMTFTLSLDAAPSSTVRVDCAVSPISATPGVDYLDPGPTTVVFPPGQLGASFTVRVLGDDEYESNEMIRVVLTNLQNVAVNDTNAFGYINNDDVAPVATLSGGGSVLEGNAGTTQLTFTIALDKTSAIPASVYAQTVNGTARGTPPKDFEAAAQTVTFLPGSLSTTLTVTIYGDTTDEGASEWFAFSLSSPAGVTLGTPSSITNTILDDDDPVLAIADASPLYQSETDTNWVAQVLVYLSSPAASTVTVTYTTANGSAVAGSDYSATTGTLTFAPGVTGLYANVPILGDDVFESDEWLTVVLSAPVGAAIVDNSGQVWIQNDDSALYIDNASPVTQAERNTNWLASFRVRVAPASTATVTVDYATASGTALAGSDFTATNGTLVFPPGATSQFVSVEILGDTVRESDESFSVQITNASGAQIQTASGSLTLQNDDAGLSIADVSAAEGTGGTNTFTFAITLSPAAATNVTFDYAVSGVTATAGADFVPVASGSIAMPAGATSTSLAVKVIGDALDESNETFQVTLSNVQNAGLSDGIGVGTIQDDDASPVVRLSPGQSVVEGNAGTTQLTVNVNLDAPSGLQVSLWCETVNGTASASYGDFQPVSQQVLIPPGATSVPVTVTVNGDTLDEGVSEWFALTIYGPANATLGSPSTVTNTILDDDDPVLTVADMSPLHQAERDTNWVAQFAVSLSSPAAGTVTVAYATSNSSALAGSDFAGTSGTLTFAPGVTTLYVNVTILGDTVPEAGESFLMALSNPVGAAIADNLATMFLDNDDALMYVAVVGTGTVPERNTNWTAQFRVWLDLPAPSTGSVSFSTMNGAALAGSDYVATNGTLVFAPGVQTQLVSVGILGDTAYELDESFRLVLSNAVNITLGNDHADLTLDNDDSALSIADVTAAEGTGGTNDFTFVITLSPAAPTNVTFDYAVTGGSAAEGLDFVAVAAGSLTLPAGRTSTSITVRVLGDATDESNETFLVTLTNAQGAGIADGLAGGTILDDDAPPQLRLEAGGSVVEGDSGSTSLTVRALLSAPSGLQVQSYCGTADGSAQAGANDYGQIAQLLVFPPGVTSLAVTVTVNGDTWDEGDSEWFTLALSGPVNATLGTPSAVTNLILDDDDPTLFLEDANPSYQLERDTNWLADFVVRLSSSAASTVTVSYTTTNGSAIAGVDYTPVSGTLTFAPGVTSLVVSVPILGDSDYEPDEVLYVRLSNPVNIAMGDSQGLLVLVNDDAAFRIDNPPGGNQAERNTNWLASFTVRLSPTSAQTCTVAYATANDTAIAGSDYTAVTGTLVFAPGVSNLTVDVPILGDTVAEPAERFFVVLSSPVNAGLADGLAELTLTNDDAALSIGNASVTEGNSGATSLVFTVSLDVVASDVVTADYTVQGLTATAGDDFLVPGPGTVTIPAGSLSTTVTVQVVGDTTVESNETLAVILSNVQNAAPANTNGLGTIVNDDPFPVLTLSGGGSVLEGNSGTTSLVFTLTLDKTSAIPASVYCQTVNGTTRTSSPKDLDLVARTVTLAPGTLSTTVVVTIYGDVLDEGASEWFTFQVGTPVGVTLAAPTVITNFIVDDDDPRLSVADVSPYYQPERDTNWTAQFEVTLSSAATGTVTVDYTTSDGSATAGSDYLATTGTLTFAPGVTSQAVNVTVVGDGAYETDENFFVVLINPVGVTIFDSAGVLNLQNDDSLMYIDNAVPAAQPERDTNWVASFRVWITPPAPDTVTVDFATSNGTASAGVDYVATNGTLTFAPGVTAQYVYVSVIGDLNIEPTNKFYVTLANPVQATVQDGTAELTLQNDDVYDFYRQATNVLVTAEMTASGTNVAVRWRATNIVFYTLQANADLINSAAWADVPGAIGLPGPTNAPWELWGTNVGGALGPAKFYRVKVTP